MSFFVKIMRSFLQLEELRADIIDLKEMYREQVDLLVNKVHGFHLNPLVLNDIL